MNTFFKKILASAAVLAILTSGFSTSSLALAKIDLNTASQTELESLPGVGAATAKKIISARPFHSVADLTQVKGIKEKQLEKLKDLVVVNDASITKMPAANAVNNTQANNTINAAANGKVAMQGATLTTAKMAKTANDKLASGERVNLNTASLEEIEKLPGIGPKKAQAIIDARPFKSPEDVMKVKGIKQGVFGKIKDSITL